MDVQTKYISQLKSNQTLINLYTDNYNESYFGYILDFNEEFLVLEKFDGDCFYDGLSIIYRHNITRIRWDGNEIFSMAKLINRSERLVEKIFIDLTDMESILKTVHNEFGHITIHIEDIDKDICFIGQINEMDSEHVVLYEFGTKQSLDRPSLLIALEDITRVEVGGRYEKQLEKIFFE